MDKVEEAVLSTFDKDFSHKIKMELAKKYKEVSTNVKAHNRKVKRGLFGGGNLFRSLFNRFRKR
jgi:hypothetical protein